MKFLCLEHIDCEGPGTFAEFMKVADIKFDIISLDSMARMPELTSYQALLVLGGPMNVYEEERYPFLKKEDELIRKAISINMPYLGICLGAQLLAKALDSKVSPNKVKEIGFMPVRLTPAGARGRLFLGLKRGVDSFQWHGDTFEIPKGAIKLASSSTCLNQAFCYGNLYALQFHLEVTEEMIKDWAEEYREELDSLGKEAREKVFPPDFQSKLEHLKSNARIVFNNFLNIAKDYTTTPHHKEIKMAQGKVIELDVRPLMPWDRHEKIFKVFDEMAPGDTLLLTNDHDPRPLHYQMMHEREGQFEWKSEEKGPKWWVATMKKIRQSRL